MHKFLLPTALLLLSRPAVAQAVSYGLDVGLLIAGDSGLKGVPANPTGGITLVPHVRVSVPVPGVSWLDLVYANSPMVVTPVSLARVGIVDANDIGLVWHSESRAFDVAMAGTMAPSHMAFCNTLWCKSELTMIYGGELHGSALVSADSHGRSMRMSVTLRLMYAQPSAWTWEGLSPRERAILPTIFMGSAGGAWTF